MDKTIIYDQTEFQDAVIEQIIREVVQILTERGYNPINQIVGYLMSGDPGYISSYKDARNKLTSINRGKILEVLVRNYI